MPLILFHRHNFFHPLNKFPRNERTICFLLPTSVVGLPVSSLPDMPSSFPPDDLVELVTLEAQITFHSSVHFFLRRIEYQSKENNQCNNR